MLGSLRRVAAIVSLLPALLHLRLRRLRTRRPRPAATAATVTRDGRAVAVVDGRHDVGTSTVETTATLLVPDAAPDAVRHGLAAARAVRPAPRRLAWIVPSDDAALLAELAAAGFEREGAAVPPPDVDRPHEQWALRLEFA